VRIYDVGVARSLRQSHSIATGFPTRCPPVGQQATPLERNSISVSGNAGVNREQQVN